MRVLIVEDNAFNAFCLTRLFETVCTDVQVSTQKDSLSAIKCLDTFKPHLVVLDGDLGADDSHYCNGPVLAALIWLKYPDTEVVAWTDNELMRKRFAEVFKTHQKLFNDATVWKKSMCHAKLLQALSRIAANRFSGNFHPTQEAFHLERLYAC